MTVEAIPAEVAISKNDVLTLFASKSHEFEQKTKGDFSPNLSLCQALPHLSGLPFFPFPFIQSQVGEYIIQHGRFLCSNTKTKRKNVVLPDDDPLARAFGKSQFKLDKVNHYLLPNLTPKPIPPPHNHYSKQMVTPSPSLLTVLHSIPMISSSCTSFTLEMIQILIIDYVYKHGDVLCNETLHEGEYEVTLQHDDKLAVAMKAHKFRLDDVPIFLFNNTKVEEEDNDEPQAEPQADDHQADEPQNDHGPKEKKRKLNDFEDSSPEQWSNNDEPSSKEQDNSDDDQSKTSTKSDNDQDKGSQKAAEDDDSDSDSQTTFRPPLRMSYEQFQQLKEIKSRFSKVIERLRERNRILRKENDDLKTKLQETEVVINDYRERAARTTIINNQQRDIN